MSHIPGLLSILVMHCGGDMHTPTHTQASCMAFSKVCDSWCLSGGSNQSCWAALLPLMMCFIWYKAQWTHWIHMNALRMRKSKDKCFCKAEATVNKICTLTWKISNTPTILRGDILCWSGLSDVSLYVLFWALLLDKWRLQLCVLFHSSACSV